jgi:hypothetical protein
MGFNRAVLLAEVERALAGLEVSHADLSQLDQFREEQVVENGPRGAEEPRSDRRRSQDKGRSWRKGRPEGVGRRQLLAERTSHRTPRRATRRRWDHPSPMSASRSRGAGEVSGLRTGARMDDL